MNFVLAQIVPDADRFGRLVDHIISAPGQELLFTLVLVLALVVVPISAARKRKTLSRLQYTYRILTLAAVLVGSNILMMVVPPFPRVPMITLLGSVIAVVLTIYIFWWLVSWSVYRVQDIGWSKWWTLLLGFPYINILYALVLLFWPGREAVPSDMPPPLPGPPPSGSSADTTSAIVETSTRRFFRAAGRVVGRLRTWR